MLLPQPVGSLAVLLLLLTVALLLRETASIVVPFLFGAFLALLASPLVGAFERRGVVRPIAVALTILAVLLVVLGALALIVLSAGQLLVLVPTYEDRLVVSLDSLQATLRQVGIEMQRDAFRLLVQPGQIAALVGAAASSVSSVGVALLILVPTMVYALVGASSLRERAVRLFGRDHRLLVGVGRFSSEIRRYVVVRAGLGLFAAAASLLLLLVLEVPLAPVWAFLVFAASFIPNVGVVLALIPPAVIAVLDGGVGVAVAVVVGYVLINLAQDSVLQPVAFGAELNLTPLVVFASVILWTWILGAAGGLLAVPLTTGLLAILEAFPASRRIAALMRSSGDQPADLAAGNPPR